MEVATAITKSTYKSKWKSWVRLSNFSLDTNLGVLAHFFFFVLVTVILFCFIIFLNVYSFLRERERDRAVWERAEREGDTETEAGSRL